MLGLWQCKHTTLLPKGTRIMQVLLSTLWFRLTLFVYVALHIFVSPIPFLIPFLNKFVYTLHSLTNTNSDVSPGSLIGFFFGNFRWLEDANGNEREALAMIKYYYGNIFNGVRVSHTVNSFCNIQTLVTICFFKVMLIHEYIVNSSREGSQL